MTHLVELSRRRGVALDRRGPGRYGIDGPSPLAETVALEAVAADVLVWCQGVNPDA